MENLTIIEIIGIAFLVIGIITIRCIRFNRTEEYKEIG